MVGIEVDEKLQKLEPAAHRDQAPAARPPPLGQPQTALPLAADEIRQITSQITGRYFDEMTTAFYENVSAAQPSENRPHDSRIALRTDVVAIGLEQARLKDAIRTLERLAADRAEAEFAGRPAVFVARGAPAVDPLAPTPAPAPASSQEGFSEVGVNLIAGYASEIESKLTLTQVDCRLQARPHLPGAIFIALCPRVGR